MAYEFQQLPVTSHTRHVGPGSTFVVVKGYKEDGIRYVPDALAAGATTIVIEEDVVIDDTLQALVERYGAQLVRVKNSRHALAELSAQAHGYPARSLTIIGITGTKGKSTTTFLLAHLLRSSGIKTAFLSTVKNCIDATDYATELTTQQPDYIHAFLRRCVEAGVTHVVMEVAAQALTLHRVSGIEFSAGAFLNFSLEHSEFYATQDDYFAAKAVLLKQLTPGACFVVPQDDVRIRGVAQAHAGTIFLESAPTTRADLAGIRFEHEGRVYACPALVGSFNIFNARVAITLAQYLGCPPATMQEALTTFQGVPGRLVPYRLAQGAIVFIDYAHNPLSFERVLGAMRGLTDHMIVVFGAGGDRDATKRPLMGAIAAQFADHIIVTTDNPRSEDPAAIVTDILAGIPPATSCEVEPDRQRAVEKACDLSRKGSLVMLLGKGPDEYQLIQGVKTPFSERAIVAAWNEGLEHQRAGFTKQSNDVTITNRYTS